MTDGLSFGEYAEVAGTCAAIVAFGVGGVHYRIRSLRSRPRDAERAASEEHERHAMLLLVLEKALAGSLSSLDFIGGLIQRILEDRTDEVAVQDVMRALGELRSGVERPWLEARTMTAGPGIQRSALQQLEQRFADGDTAAFLTRGANAGRFGEVGPAGLLEIAQEITDRNEQRQEHSNPSAES